MAVGPGKFQLYSKLDPVMAAGDYRFVTDQTLDGPDESTPIETLHTHVRVRAPRYLLPPDQVLSTFPPAGSVGSYGSRLPQIVIRRRTLPWERDLAGQPSATPWLALVLIAEGEGTIELNQPVADCVTPGVELAGVADTKLGSYLSVRRSVVHRAFPTRRDVPLLAHAREVDINDTELMMGDDDGFLSVVISNRLPLAGRDPDGDEQPVKYLACLVNLEGQFDSLLPESPPRLVSTQFPVVTTAAVMTTAEYDQVKMTSKPGLETSAVQPLAATDATTISASSIATTGTPPYVHDTNWSLEDAESVASGVYAEMAADFHTEMITDLGVFDPELRFPVLLHWSFVSAGTATFKNLMKNLDSGLIGTVPADRPPPEGRDPVETVETGHVGLAHRTRRGDEVRSWYRGPVVPHPNHDATADRLPLAHVSDQLRVVIPDGREDVSLASAFEIGRLLALSRPSVVAALMRWRQDGYHVERRAAIWGAQIDFLRDILGDIGLELVDDRIGVALGRGFARRLAGSPEAMIGGPRPLVDPGRPLDLDADVPVLVASGFGLGDVDLSADPADVLDKLRGIEALPGTDLEVDLPTTTIRDSLHRATDLGLVDLVANTLDLQVDLGVDDQPGGIGLDPVIVGPTVPGTVLGGGLVIEDGVITGGVIDGGVVAGGGVAPLSERIRARRRQFDRTTDADDTTDDDDGEESR